MSSSNGFEGKVRHGTHSGWSTHKALGEQPCDACYQAKREYDKRYKSSIPKQRKARALARAANRALKRLRHAYPEEYRKFYLEERAQVLLEEQE